MKRIVLIAAVLFCSLSVSSLYAQMTDEQVVEYVKSASAAGKNQDQISRELLLRGVTQEQAERIRARVQSQQASGAQGAAQEG
ncbi:MAG: capsule biosynthesis protein, partial [Bacteroidales bacterium]|nr:capsule biosynthesis protein [Bacteroidales bacterium]